MPRNLKTRFTRKSRRSGKPTKCASPSLLSATKSAWACATSGFLCSIRLPGIYSEIVESFRDVYGITLDELTVPNVIHFGSWIGGDRDGNPLVKPGCIRDALDMARAVILNEYLHDVEAAEQPPQLFAAPGWNLRGCSCTACSTTNRPFPDVHLAWGPENRVESYRRFLSYIFHKLQKTRDSVHSAAAYSNAAEFEYDFRCCCRQA